MAAPYLAGYRGYGVTRAVTLTLPVQQVRGFLARGLELLAQDVTPPGTHPVVIQFHCFSQCNVSIPNPMPDLEYHEQTFGIPFTRIVPGWQSSGSTGPLYYMPRLYLDHSFVVLGGFTFFGFIKHMTRIEVTADRYTVNAQQGSRIASLAWPSESTGDFRRPDSYAGFATMRGMLSQALVSLLPAGEGPFFALSDFPRKWDVARVRPLRTRLDVEVPYAAGFDRGSYPESGWNPGIDEAPLGSFELHAPWWLSFPYSPLLAGGQS
ncbi:MAG: hypothetical protein ABI759_21960 [Candidatus Solibacter sp.]